MARSWSTKWSSTKTCIGSATSEAPRAFSSAWPSKSADAAKVLGRGVGPSGRIGILLADMTTSFVDVSVLDADELENELATLASHLYAGTCRWLELVAELDRRGDWAVQGAYSPAHW